MPQSERVYFHSKDELKPAAVKLYVPKYSATLIGVSENWFQSTCETMIKHSQAQ